MNKKVCLIGAGQWGENHLKTLAKLNSLYGVVELNSDIRNKISENYPNVNIYSNLEDSFKDDFEGYIVATPAPTHYKIAKRIINMNHHVLIEKPMTLNSKDAIDLTELAKNNEVNIMVGHVLIFHPAIQKIKEMISSDLIGKVQYIYSNRLNLGRVRSHENVFWSFAPHDISIFQFLLEDFPNNIKTSGGVFIQENIHDTTLTILEYPNNIKTHIYLSWLHPFKEHRIVVIGSDGMISFEDSHPDKPLFYYNKAIIKDGSSLIKSDGEVKLLEYQKTPPLELEIKYFLNHLNGDKIDLCSGEDAVNTIKILELATKSLME